MATFTPPGLLKEFGPTRIRRTPISEQAMTGIAIGSACLGYRPIVNWRCTTFTFVAFDQIVNQAAKLRYMSGGQRNFPIVFRTFFNGGLRSAAQHSQSAYAMYAHAHGLKIIVPSSAADALGLLKSAIRDNNPVVCFEATRLDNTEEQVPDGDHVVPLGVASVKREGKDVTVVALAYMVRLALQAADELAAEGIDVEVIDPRSLIPLDVETIRRSIRNTGRLVVVDESPPTCSVASEIAAITVEDRETFRALRAPVQRVVAKPVPVPYSPPLEDFVLPGKPQITAAIRAVIAD